MTHAVAHQQATSILKCILVACIGYACFNVGDAVLKGLTTKFHYSETMLFIGVAMVAVMASLGAVREGRKAFRSTKVKWNILRSVLMQVCIGLNIFAFTQVQLTTFYTLVFTSPFWVALLSIFVLKDKVEFKRLAAIAIGFAVVLFIYRPGSGMFSMGAVATLVSALVYSFSLIVVRHIGKGESLYFMAMTSGTVSTVTGLLLLGNHFILPSIGEAGLFLLVGAMTALGSMAVSYAFQHAPAVAVVAPYHYTQILWGALLGYFFFQEVPSLQTLVGAGVLVSAGLYLLHGEAKQAKKNRVVEEIPAL